jgi:hypothetical protein
MIGHQRIGMDGASVSPARNPLASQGTRLVVLDGDETGLAIVAALNQVQPTPARVVRGRLGMWGFFFIELTTKHWEDRVLSPVVLAESTACTI